MNHSAQLRFVNKPIVLLIVLFLAISGLWLASSMSVYARDDRESRESSLSSGEARGIGDVNVTKISSEHESQNSSRLPHLNHSTRDENSKALINRRNFVPPGQDSKTISVGPGPQVVTSGLVLEGVPGTSPNPCSCSPPDPNLGVGPNHVFEMSNLAGIIYSKSGTLVRATFGLDSFFNLPASSMSDPEIMFDAGSDRWFASIVNIPAGRVQFAVSSTSDPTGTFKLYSVATSSTRFLPDQPFIGTNDDKFVISANIFDSRSDSFVGVEYWVLNKADAVSGGGSIHFVTNAPDFSMISLHPARHQTSTSAFYLVSDCTGSCVTNQMTTTSTAEFVILTGLPPSAVTVTKRTFPISTSSAPPDAQQPGTSTLLKTNDNRILSAVWENNILWFSASDACIPPGENTTRSCLRLVEASTSGTLQPTKIQDFDYASSGEYLFYPALSLYQGQVAVVYGKTSSTVFPSLFVTGRISSDLPNTLQTPTTIRTGNSADHSSRYGDYFGAATDPTPTPDSTFWVAGEYRSSSANAGWSTAIARVGSLSSISVHVAGSNVFQGYNVTTTGSLTVSSTTGLSGSLLVIARNATSSSIAFSKLYNVSGLELQSMHGQLQASIVLNVDVLPSALSSDVTVTIVNSTSTASVQVTKQLDVASAGFVSIVDLGFVYQDYGRAVGDSLFEPQADLDGNGVITITDVGLVTFYYAAPVLR